MKRSPGPQRSPRTTSDATTPADASMVRATLQELASFAFIRAHVSTPTLELAV